MLRAILGWLCRLDGILVVITVTAAAVVGVLVCKRRRQLDRDRTTIMIVLVICFIAVALIGSYGILLHPVDVPPDYKSLLNPLVLFLLNVLAILFTFFLITIVAIGLLDPWRAEITAKLLGAEFSYKMRFEASQKSVDELGREADRTRELLTQAFQAFQDLQDWSNLITRLNGAVLEFLGTPYEEMLTEAANPPDALRQAIKDVLMDAYEDMGDSVTIHVIPLSDEVIGTLDDRLAARVRLSRVNGDDIVVIREGTGIAIYHRDDGFGTVIVLEGQEGYEVTLPEICAAGTLFTAATGTVLNGLAKRP